MAIMQNAFANTSSSLLISKVQGNIVDVLMPPMAEYELTFSYMLGGITRGLLVGFFFSLFIFMVVDLKIFNFLLFYILPSFHQVYCQCLEFYVEFGQKSLTMAAVTNFIIIPLTFLSGLFIQLIGYLNFGSS